MAAIGRHWFLIALGVCFTVGFVASESLTWLAEASWLRNGVVFVVMAITGVTLRADAIRGSLATPGPSLLAIGLNILAVPLLTSTASLFLSGSLFGGLYVASLVPCTLASAAVWTRRAGGDDSVALMTTVVTNLACLLVIPLGLWILPVGGAASPGGPGEVSTSEQMMKIAGLVVAPLILAQILRRLGGDVWADSRKRKLQIAAQIGILTMVVFGAVASAGVMDQHESSAVERSASLAAAAMATGEQTGDSGSGLLGLTTLVFASAVIHLLVLVIGIAMAKRLGFSRERQIAVGFAGSQKTLMVGLQVAIDCGVSVLPMIVYHVSQLVLDTLVANRWARPEKSGA